MKKRVLVISSLIGYGDLLYLTPLIRFLANTDHEVTLWTVNPEPFMYNPHIAKVYFTKRIDNIRVPTDFYYAQNLVFSKFDTTCGNNHTIDYYMQKTYSFVLRDKEKTMDLFWSKKDEDKIEAMMGQDGLIPNTDKNCNFVVISPTLTWPSRTLPLKFYKDLIKKIQANGDKVVLVGKSYMPSDTLNNVTDKLNKQEVKGLYPIDEFPDCIDYTNKLSLQELGAFSAKSKIAFNGENGNMVISTTNNNCWNIYMPAITAPEYRLPWRHGCQDYKTVVIGNEDDYYASSDYKTLWKGPVNLSECPVIVPSIDRVFNAYLQVNDGFINGNTKINFDT